MSDLLTIDGIGSDEVELLEATGWTDLSAVAKANVDVLVREMAAANDMLKIVPRVPERRKVERWVASAARLVDPAAAPAPARSSRARTKTVVKEEQAEAPAPAPKKRRRSSKAAKEEAPPVVDEVVPEPVTELPQEEAVPEEAPVPLEPVNYEENPEVMEMLAVAPVAVPLPARLLAEQGIGPTEIAIAPVLNRALGDLEVRVAIEREEEEETPEVLIPEAPAVNRRAVATAAVHIGDLGGRRRFDASRVRTIEEAQGDAPVERRSASKAGMEDDRIALLRAPRPETNKGRNPNSRFYIRGVLHDQPLKVWFGGFFLVLLQFCIPLAVVAAPLLILHDEKPEQFAWVPKWIIAFPIAVPILGVFYALLSTRAKCRVCAQRMYVPKHCLKNKKAHHLPLFGYIGAVAMHVMAFKWFNCTFCGTSIRIKK
ncbi:DUF4332 domain-containing protein [Luteolibacter sp. GHJ8]|uniref:DUF4332 domain-containing protein n=1 Tax=Luteolibacter rhizosphaerae TaxID=2989719 RepID=A0ABT3GB81_9BACT|nr:DUF4332 domain-containing protein [Luteolibacter rhizosphaerae]MCW1916892.1 DUF4332 domain-containing protein [Luteolibacter rhizosphaerae]